MNMLLVFNVTFDICLAGLIVTIEHIAGGGGSEDSGYELTCGTPLPNLLCNNFETPHFTDLVHALHKQETNIFNGSTA